MKNEKDALLQTVLLRLISSGTGNTYASRYYVL